MSIAMSEITKERPMALNPFRGSVEVDAWGTGDAERDVTSIHRSAFAKCCEAVDAVRSGDSSAGIVVHGQAGSGKTHLIGRLRRRFTDPFIDPTYEQLTQAFAYVQLNTHFSSLRRHTRRCVANDLLRSFSGSSQLERLAVTRLMSVAEGGGCVKMWWDYLLEERRDDLDALLYELGDREQLSPDIVTVLGHVIRRRHRLEVSGWLRGDPLTDLAYDRLGIAPANPDDDPEQQAWNVLRDVMRLAGPEIPLVLCFDQVEALQVTREETQAFFAFAQLIADLYNADRNLVLISCMQTEFSELMARQVPEYALARMKGYAVCQLLPLNLDQSRQLLVNRLRRRESTREAQGDLSPLTDQDLKNFLGKNGHCSPRELLDRAARRFDELRGTVVETKPLAERLADEWENRRESALRSNTPEQTEDILRDGLPRLVHAVDPEWRTSQGRPAAGLDYVLTGPLGEASVGVKVCTGVNANSLWRPLQKLNSLYPERMQPKLQKLVLLRDERTPIRKSATKTLELIASLEKKDALFYRVSPEALAALDALRKLLADSQAGDLDIDGETLTFTTVLDWLRGHLDGALRELADVLITQDCGEIRSTLTDRMQESLVENYVASAEVLSQELQVSANELVDAARNRPDLFGVVEGTPTAIFSARFGGRCISLPVPAVGG